MTLAGGVTAISLSDFTVSRSRQRSERGFDCLFWRLLPAISTVRFGDRLVPSDLTPVADWRTVTAEAAVRWVAGRVYNTGGDSRVALRGAFDLSARVSHRQVTMDEQRPEKGDMRDTDTDTTGSRHDLALSSSVALEDGLRAMWREMEATRA